LEERVGKEEAVLPEGLLTAKRWGEKKGPSGGRTLEKKIQKKLLACSWGRGRHEPTRSTQRT